jgi:hypothetical protein
MDEEARPHLILKVWKKSDPLDRRVSRRIRVFTGVTGEVLVSERAAGGGFTVIVRAFCDDLERALDRGGWPR